MHFLHVISAIVLVGLPIAGYFYLALSYSKQGVNHPFTLKLTFILDTLVIIPLIFFVFATGLALNFPIAFLFHIPWVISSCIYLLLVLIFVIINLWLKLRVYFQFKTTGKVHLQTIFHFISILQIILLIMITHDMVIERTWIAM